MNLAPRRPTLRWSVGPLTLDVSPRGRREHASGATMPRLDRAEEVVMGGVPADEDAVGRALAAVVARWGAGIASDPRRLDASLEDELMGAAASHRPELHALLVAAEESIPA